MSQKKSKLLKNTTLRKTDLGTESTSSLLKHLPPPVCSDFSQGSFTLDLCLHRLISESMKFYLLIHKKILTMSNLKNSLALSLYFVYSLIPGSAEKN